MFDILTVINGFQFLRFRMIFQILCVLLFFDGTCGRRLKNKQAIGKQTNKQTNKQSVSFDLFFALFTFLNHTQLC